MRSGAVAQWRSGAVPQWGSGAVAQWRSGAVAQWRSGAVAQWRSGAVAQWRSGAVAQWRSGAVAQWRSGEYMFRARSTPISQNVTWFFLTVTFPYKETFKHNVWISGLKWCHIYKVDWHRSGILLFAQHTESSNISSNNNCKTFIASISLNNSRSEVQQTKSFG